MTQLSSEFSCRNIHVRIVPASLNVQKHNSDLYISGSARDRPLFVKLRFVDRFDPAQLGRFELLEPGCVDFDVFDLADAGTDSELVFLEQVA